MSNHNIIFCTEWLNSIFDFVYSTIQYMRTRYIIVIFSNLNTAIKIGKGSSLSNNQFLVSRYRHLIVTNKENYLHFADECLSSIILSHWLKLTS
jgi:hypothetical protein